METVVIAAIQLTVKRQVWNPAGPLSKPPEGLLNRRDLFWWARILYGYGSGRGEAEQLLAVQQPCAFGHKSVLARDPFLDFLVGDALAGWLLLSGLMARLARTSSIVFSKSP